MQKQQKSGGGGQGQGQGRTRNLPPTWRRNDVCEQVSARTGHDIDTVANIEQAFEFVCLEGLRQGNHIQLQGFATFSPKETAPRTGRSPATGQAVQIPAKHTMRLKVHEPALRFLGGDGDGAAMAKPRSGRPRKAAQPEATAARTARAGGGRGARARTGQAGGLAAAYRNPTNPAETWDGQGAAPHWFRNALAAGIPMQSLMA